ncbi:hypothetical protein EVAR_24641_1 [Eumeta japonica]|uniref:Uncharacterized protein n=1 Tax=Eumeta variegata TaxID=151549 RepID=A0A4C1V2G8_EUMVA|nr:hypothetical protein EVAR_24641_1 [Eumeta japonica]
MNKLWTVRRSPSGVSNISLFNSFEQCDFLSHDRVLYFTYFHRLSRTISTPISFCDAAKLICRVATHVQIGGRFVSMPGDGRSRRSSILHSDSVCVHCQAGHTYPSRLHSRTELTGILGILVSRSSCELDRY